VKKNLKIPFLLIALSLIVILLNSCGGILGITIGQAEILFVQWLVDDYGEPTDPAIALFLGEGQVGDVIGSFSPGTPIEQQNSREFSPLNEAAYVFYLDEMPGAFYDHPGVIVLISKSGVLLEAQETDGWPTKNQERFPVIDSPTSEMFFNAIFWQNNDIIRAVQAPFAATIIARLNRYGAVVVNGLTDEQNLYTEGSNAHDNMVKAMEAVMDSGVGGTYDLVRSVDYPSNTPTDFANAVAELVGAPNYVSNLTLYFIAHGSIDYMNIGGIGYSDSTLKTLIQSYPNVNFSIIVETCHGGSWKDYFQTQALGNVDIVITSTSAAKGAYPDWDNSAGMTDYNAADDQWVEWTSDFILQIQYYTSGDHWAEVTAFSTAHGVNTKVGLYYMCFQRVKGLTPPTSSLVLTERPGIAIQDPQVYAPGGPY